MRAYRLYGTELPFTGKISTAASLGGRTHRPNCHCCGGSYGIRRGFRRVSRHSPEYQRWMRGECIWKDVPSRGHRRRRQH